MTFASLPVRPTILDRNCPNGQFRLVDRLLRLGVLAGFQEANRLKVMPGPNGCQMRHDPVAAPFRSNSDLLIGRAD
jgi:hypothetical protein